MKTFSPKLFGIVLLCVAVGVLAGLLIPQDGLRTAVLELARSVSIRTKAAVPTEEHDQHEEHANHAHVELSDAAQKTLRLKRMVLSPTSYVASTNIPAVVIERPAISDLHVVTEFEGIVEEITAIPGQAVREGDPLFRIRLTGDALASAQSAFLNAVQEVDILNKEIERLKKAAQDGGLAKKSLIELEYERNRLAAQQETKKQELMIRGLSEAQVETIVETRQLIRDVIVNVPTGFLKQQMAQMAPADPWMFTIEDLLVTQGLLVRAGAPLANLAFHASLYLEGLAFERDVAAVAKLLENKKPITAELGEDRQPVILNDLRIVHLSNHVDEDSQAYPFYVELDNQVLQDSIRNDGRLFRSWKFKPGQRGHVRLPQQTFTNIFRVPAEAVVVDGLEHIVFRKEAAHNHGGADHKDHEDHAAHEEMDAFEPVPVQVLHKDRRYAVLAMDGELKIGNVIAANAAYQLLLATKSESGGGHDHGHAH